MFWWGHDVAKKHPALRQILRNDLAGFAPDGGQFGEVGFEFIVLADFIEGEAVEIGKGAAIGALTTVLYDTRVGENARLGPLTIVMKGERIPANTEWAGAPAAPA